MIELKKCPFCGGEVLMTSDMADAYHEYFSFECVHCNMTMTYQYYDKEEAIKTFNTRKPMDDIVERLEKECLLANAEYYDSCSVASLGEMYGYSQAVKIVKGEV